MGHLHTAVSMHAKDDTTISAHLSLGDAAVNVDSWHDEESVELNLFLTQKALRRLRGFLADVAAEMEAREGWDEHERRSG